MVSLMAKGAGEQAFAGLGEIISGHILRPYRGVERPRRLSAEYGQAQAAFLFRLRALDVDDLGIDQHQAPAGVFAGRDINNAKALRNPYLGSCQAHATRSVHRLEHVGDEFLEVAVEARHRRRGFFENLFAKFDDGIDHFKNRGK